MNKHVNTVCSITQQLNSAYLQLYIFCFTVFECNGCNTKEIMVYNATNSTFWTNVHVIVIKGGWFGFYGLR